MDDENDVSHLIDFIFPLDSNSADTDRNKSLKKFENDPCFSKYVCFDCFKVRADSKNQTCSMCIEKHEKKANAKRSGIGAWKTPFGLMPAMKMGI